MSLAGQILRVLRNRAIIASRIISSEFSYRMATGDTASQIISRQAGQMSLGRRACVFAHFDAAGQVRAHTRDYLLALREVGYGIVFVTNAGALAPESAAWLEGQCHQVLVRRNLGYDFGAFRDGILALETELAGLDSLLIANDSVYGPLHPLADIQARQNFVTADVWSMTDSWQHRFHLQSYFVAFGPMALCSRAFLDFWRGVRNLRSKWAAVRFYELRMTQHYQRAGLRCAAMWDYVGLVEAMLDLDAAPEPEEKPALMDAALRVVARFVARHAQRRVALNPTSDMWLVLLERGYPFIKRELLRDNPGNAPDLQLWHRIARQSAPEAYRHIIEDMKRTIRGVSP